jgi:hypothetical protein
MSLMITRRSSAWSARRLSAAEELEEELLAVADRDVDDRQPER